MSTLKAKLVDNLDLISEKAKETCNLEGVASFSFFLKQHSDGDYSIEMGDFLDDEGYELEDMEEASCRIEENIIWEFLDFDLVEQLDLIDCDLDVVI